MIGAPRAGTTALYRYLQQHPGLYLGTVKEPSFFACGEAAIEVVGRGSAAADEVAKARSVLTWDGYRALYEAAPPDALIGDASPTYLYLPHVPEVLAHHLPDAKLIVALRQPAERAWSHLNADAGGAEVAADELIHALEAEDADPRTSFVGHHDYLRPSRFGEALERWLARFPRPQLHVILHEDLESDPSAVLRQTFAFLGVDDGFEPDTSVRYNISGPTARFSATNGLRRLRRFAHLLPDGLHRRAARLRSQVAARDRQPTALDPDVRRIVTERWFADDVVRLERLLGIDLARWR